MQSLREKLKLATHALRISRIGRSDETTHLLTESERQDREIRRLRLHNKRASLTGEFISFTSSSSALQLCLLAILVYFIVAIIAFSVIFEPDWTLIDSLYFAVVTFTTVGYGDLYPTTEAGQIFTIFFVLSGIVILGVALGIIGDRVIQAQEGAIDSVKTNAQSRVMGMFSEGTEEAQDVKEIIADANEKTASSVWADFCEAIVKDGPILVVILGLAIIIGRKEEWSYVNTFYYAIITTTTVGYGDIEPQTQSMRLFAVFFIPISVAVLANILGRIAGFYMDRQAAKHEKNFLQKELTLADLAVMDADGDGGVSLGEFLSFMLVAMQKVDKESVDDLIKLFCKLDADGSGQLQKQDLILLAKSSSETRTSPGVVV